MSVIWEIDPTSEDAANVPLVLVDNTFRLTEMDLTPPEVDAIYAASADTEGDPYVGSRHRNRTISLTFIALSTTNALLQTAVYGVQQKVDKLRREGGTLKLTTQAGTTAVGDVLFARFKPEFTPEMYVLNKAVRFGLEFECKPYFRGAPVQLSDHAETTLPSLVFTETSVAGDASALGKLIIDNDESGADYWWLAWGLENNAQYDVSATSAALFYEAEGRTPMGGAAIAAGPSGASGSGSNVMRHTALTPSYQAIMSTQAVSAGAHLSHVGGFRVFARVQTAAANTGVVSIALEWGEGDFRTFTRNDSVVFPVDVWDATWRLIDLGQVNPRKVAQGTQRWEGRILARSTIFGDDLDIDCLWLVPVDRSGVMSGVAAVFASPTSFLAHDEFDQADGALSGKTLPVGGTWAGAGDADDFSVSATFGQAITRQPGAADADVNTGRYLIAGSTSYTNVTVQMRVRVLNCGTSTTALGGAMARYVDTSNWMMATLYSATPVQTNGAGTWMLLVRKRVAGTVTTMASAPLSFGYLDDVTGGNPGTSAQVRVSVDSSGRWLAWVRDALILTGQDPVLATGGALATGKPGMYHAYVGATPPVHVFDDFWVSTPVVDAAVYASQSLELRSDRVIREDSAGVVWQPVSAYEGDYLRVNPSGQEGRTDRFTLIPSRHDPVTMPHDFGDLSARLTYTPRFLVLPA